MTKTIADIIVQSLANTGVKRMYGLPGDSLNGFTDALRRNGTRGYSFGIIIKSRLSPPEQRRKQ